MSAIASPLAVTSSPKWIINQRDDLIWFIGSALVGYLALAVVSSSPEAAGPFALVWMLLINGPHFFATWTRTYFDAEQRRSQSRMLWMILPISIVPVAIVLMGGTTVLFVFAALWGTFHIAKQHVGIMMLYKRKNNERADVRIDKWFLIVSQILPLALFVYWYLSLPSLPLFYSVALSIQIALALAYAGRQVIKYQSGQVMNWPKLLLLALVIPLHWLAFRVAAESVSSGVLVFTIATNIGHALQYHRLTWFHNRNRYQGGPGFSGLLSRSAIYFYGAAFVLYLAYLLIGKAIPTGGNELILIGPIFMHYFLDSKIWRTRSDKELANALRL